MWRQRFRVSTVLYIFCRYALPGNLLYLFAIANKLTHGVGFYILFFCGGLIELIFVVRACISERGVR